MSEKKKSFISERLEDLIYGNVYDAGDDTYVFQFSLMGVISRFIAYSLPVWIISALGYLNVINKKVFKTVTKKIEVNDVKE